LLSAIRSPFFGNKSGKLGWIWMKLGRPVESRPEKTKLCTFPATSHYGFRRYREKWVAEALFFCHVYDALLSLSLDRFPPNFPRTRVEVVARDIWFHIPEKFPLRGRISRKKTVFLGYFRYPVCARPTGHGKCSATPRLFPSPWCTSHRYALTWWLLLRDIQFSSYPRPNVFLCHGISNAEIWMAIFFSNILVRGCLDQIKKKKGKNVDLYSASRVCTPLTRCRHWTSRQAGQPTAHSLHRSPICTGTLLQCTFSSFPWVLRYCWKIIIAKQSTREVSTTNIYYRFIQIKWRNLADCSWWNNVCSTWA